MTKVEGKDLSEVERLVVDMTAEILKLREENRTLQERLEKLEKRPSSTYRSPPRIRYGVSDE